MNNILIYSQDEKYTCFCRCLAIGARTKTGLIGNVLKGLLEKNNIDVDELIKKMGNSYRDSIMRVLEDKEVPNEKTLEKLVKFFEVDSDYFEEKELENVLITDNGIIIAQYKTNARAQEVKKQLDQYIRECYIKGQPIVLELPKE